MNQRWRDKRDSYRPAGETIDTRRYEVARLPGDGPAKAFVLAHHYSGSFPSARFNFGLYRREALVGVGVFSHPSNDRALTNVFPVPALEATDLGRFVLLDDVPANGETWMLARCFELLAREGIVGAISFSDPSRRTNADGLRVFGGHVGTIYQAFNGIYLGRATARTQHLLPDGQILSPRAQQKIRDGFGTKGFDYSCELLRRWGADAPWDDTTAWLKHWRGQLTRPLRHQGNHKYAWTIDRMLRRTLCLYPMPQYPKQVDEDGDVAIAA